MLVDRAWQVRLIFYTEQILNWRQAQGRWCSRDELQCRIHHWFGILRRWFRASSYTRSDKCTSQHMTIVRSYLHDVNLVDASAKAAALCPVVVIATAEWFHALGSANPSCARSNHSTRMPCTPAFSSVS